MYKSCYLIDQFLGFLVHAKDFGANNIDHILDGIKDTLSLVSLATVTELTSLQSEIYRKGQEGLLTHVLDVYDFFNLFYRRSN